jgi:hypothetical protein
MRANQARRFRAAHRKRSNLVRPACRRPECAPGTAESGSVQRHGVARSRDERLLDIARGLRVPFAAAELEVTPAALPGSVSPLHVRAASPAALDLGHGQRVRGAQDVRRVRYAVVRIGDRSSLNTCLTNKTKMDSGGTWRAITGHAPSKRRCVTCETAFYCDLLGPCSVLLEALPPSARPPSELAGWAHDAEGIRPGPRR